MGGMGRGRCGFKGIMQRESCGLHEPFSSSGYLFFVGLGPRVRKLQQRLGVPVDGVFGEKTEEAVKEFQVILSSFILKLKRTQF